MTPPRPVRTCWRTSSGYLFGNPKHSDGPGNLMSYERTQQPPFLDATQTRNVERTLRALVASGGLVPLANPGSAP